LLPYEEDSDRRKAGLDGLLGLLCFFSPSDFFSRILFIRKNKRWVEEGLKIN
jgi:hypothetical protein